MNFGEIMVMFSWTLHYIYTVSRLTFRSILKKFRKISRINVRLGASKPFINRRNLFIFNNRKHTQNKTMKFLAVACLLGVALSIKIDETESAL